MDKDTIAAKIGALQGEAQARLTTLAQADPVWANLQGQIGAWNEAIGELGDEDQPVEKGSKVGSKNAQEGS